MSQLSSRLHPAETRGHQFRGTAGNSGRCLNVMETKEEIQPGSCLGMKGRECWFVFALRHGKRCDSGKYLLFCSAGSFQAILSSGCAGGEWTVAPGMEKKPLSRGTTKPGTGPLRFHSADLNSQLKDQEVFGKLKLLRLRKCGQNFLTATLCPETRSHTRN